MSNDKQNSESLSNSEKKFSMEENNRPMVYTDGIICHVFGRILGRNNTLDCDMTLMHSNFRDKVDK